MRLDVASEDYLRRFRGWDIVSLTSSKEPKGLKLRLRPPRSCRAIQLVAPALDADADLGYGPSGRVPPGAEMVPPSRQGPAHENVSTNSDGQESAAAAALNGVGIVAGSGPNHGRANRCGHVQALAEPTPGTSDGEDGMAVDGEMDAANLKAAVKRSLVLPTWVNCASVPKIGRPGRRFDVSLGDGTHLQPMLPVQRRRSDGHALKLMLVSPPQQDLQDPPQRPLSQLQLQSVQLQGLQSEEVGVAARYKNQFTDDGVLNLRTAHGGMGRDARIVQLLWPAGSNVEAAAPREASRPHDSSAWRSDTARQDVQQQQLRGATGGTIPELCISRDPFMWVAPTHDPYTTLEDPPIQRRPQASPLGEALREPRLTAALLIPHAFVSHGIPNARPGDQVPVVLTVDDGSRGKMVRYGISATEAAAKAVATSGHYPGTLMVQRDGSGVLADMHISEAIAKYHGWATVGWHISDLDESLGGVYWVEWRVRNPPPLVPAPLSLQPPPALQPRGAMAMAAALQRCDTTEEAAANDEGALLKALQKLVWQQKALEEQLARMQARRVVQHEKQRLHQSSPEEQLRGLLLLRQQQQPAAGDFNQEDEPQAQPLSLRQLQSKALETIIMPGLHPRPPQQQSEPIRVDATHGQVEWDAHTGPVESVDPFGSSLAGTADDAKHGGRTGSKEYDADVRAVLSNKTSPTFIESRDVLMASPTFSGGSRPAASKRFVQTPMAGTASLLTHQRSSRQQLLQPEALKPPKLPPLQQQQRRPPILQLKVETEARLDSLAGSGDIDELTSSHSPSLDGANTPSSPLAPQSAWPEAIPFAPPESGSARDRTKRFRASDDGAAAAAEKQATRDSLRITDHVAPLDANEGDAAVPDPGAPRALAVLRGQSQASGAPGGTPAAPEDDDVVARSAPRLMSRYLTSGEIRVLFTDRDSRVLCSPPCGLLLTIQILLDGQPLGPPQEAQLCRYNGSSPRYLTSVPAQELTSPPIPWKRLAETTIQYRRCRSGLLQLWATRRRGASAAGSGRGPEEGVLQLTAKAAAAMPKLVSFKPAGLRRAAWLAASGSGAGGGDGDGGGIDGEDESDGGDGVIGNADGVEPPLLPAPASLSAGGVRDGVLAATQPTHGGFGTSPLSQGSDGDRGNFTIAVGGLHEDAAHATEHQVEGPLSATDGKAKLEGNTSGLDPLSGRIGLGNVPNDFNRGMHYNTLPGELRAVGGRGMAAPRSQAEAAAAWGTANESPEGAEPQYCTEVLVACRPRSLSRYVTKAELELLVGQEVYEQLCSGNKLADVRVMFEVNGRRLPEVFIADIERYNASSPFYLKAASGRGVDGLPWRSVPPNATVQWRRMADNTLVLAQVSNTTRWDSNGRNTTTSRPNSYQRRACTRTAALKRRSGAGRGHKRFTEEATESENGPSDEEYGSGDTENDVQPSQKRRRTRKAAPARQPSQGDDLLEVLAGAAGRALMEKEVAELDGAGGMGVNEMEDEDEDEVAGRRRKRSHKAPDVARRSLESSASPSTAAGEPQNRRNSCGGIDAHHPRESGNGTTAGRAFALLPSVASSGGLGVLTCPSPTTQSQLSAGSQGTSSFISRIVATNLYIGRRQLQALYGPGFKADTRSDMQLSLNGTLMPEIYHV
ncbi:hypothetical protein VaNZ11_004471, partial [Volvox africanus]